MAIGGFARGAGATNATMTDDLGPKVSEHHGFMGAYIMGTPLCALTAVACGYAASEAPKNQTMFGVSALVMAAAAIALGYYGMQARLYRVYVWTEGVTWSFWFSKGRVRYREILDVKVIELRGRPVLLALDTIRGRMEVPLGVTSRDEMIDVIVERAPKRAPRSKPPASAAFVKTA
jgi:hypothetical protein